MDALIEKLQKMLSYKIPGIQVYFSDTLGERVIILPPSSQVSDWRSSPEIIYHLCRLNHPDWDEIKFPAGVKLELGPFLFDTEDHALYQDIWSLNWLKSRFDVVDNTKKMKYH